MKLAAASEGVESEDFLSEAREKNVVSLAIKPVTLKFLLKTYCYHNGQFPTNQTLCDLYLDGCRLLCEEVNRNRRESGLKGKLENEQRLIIAARIAAVIIFANRLAVWTDIHQGDVPEEDVLLHKLSWGHECVPLEESLKSLRQRLNRFYILVCFHRVDCTGWHGHIKPMLNFWLHPI